MSEDKSDDANLCTYCGAEIGCEHLLAYIDKSFLECCGGYAVNRFLEFNKHIEDAFRIEKQRGTVASPVWKDDQINELWKFAQEQTSSDYPDDVEIDHDTLFRLIIEIMEDCGAEDFQYINDEENEQPGFSSSVSLIYADDPAKVFNAAISLFLERLQQRVGG